MTETNPDTTDAPETTPTPEPGDLDPDNGGEEGGDEGGEGGDAGEGEGAGPAEDIQNDPAYNPDDPALKGIKGG